VRRRRATWWAALRERAAEAAPQPPPASEPVVAYLEPLAGGGALAEVRAGATLAPVPRSARLLDRTGKVLAVLLSASDMRRGFPASVAAAAAAAEVVRLSDGIKRSRGRHVTNEKLEAENTAALGVRLCAQNPTARGVSVHSCWALERKRGPSAAERHAALVAFGDVWWRPLAGAVRRAAPDVAGDLRRHVSGINAAAGTRLAPEYLLWSSAYVRKDGSAVRRGSVSRPHTDHDLGLSATAYALDEEGLMLALSTGAGLAKDHVVKLLDGGAELVLRSHPMDLVVFDTTRLEHSARWPPCGPPKVAYTAVLFNSEPVLSWLRRGHNDCTPPADEAAWQARMREERSS